MPAPTKQAANPWQKHRRSDKDEGADHPEHNNRWLNDYSNQGDDLSRKAADIETIEDSANALSSPGRSCEILSAVYQGAGTASSPF